MEIVLQTSKDLGCAAAPSSGGWPAFACGASTVMRFSRMPSTSCASGLYVHACCAEHNMHVVESMTRARKLRSQHFVGVHSALAALCKLSHVVDTRLTGCTVVGQRGQSWQSARGDVLPMTDMP